jgi:hypothetical protein
LVHTRINGRLDRLGIFKVKLRSITVFANSFDGFSLSARLSFRAGLTQNQIKDLFNNLISDPLPALAVLHGTQFYKQRFVAIVEIASNPMFFPECSECKSTLYDSAGNLIHLDDLADDIKEIEKNADEADDENTITDEDGNELTQEELDNIAELEGELQKAKEEFNKCKTDGIFDCDETDIKSREKELNNAINQEESSSSSDSETTAIVVTVIVVVVVVMIAILALVLVRNHHMYDEVYGAAGGAVYSNPAYAGPPGGVENFLGVGAQAPGLGPGMNVPPPAAATAGAGGLAVPKKGLIRQESMC